MFFKIVDRDPPKAGEGIKIVYDDVAPYAKENSTPQVVKAVVSTTRAYTLTRACIRPKQR